MQAYLVALLQVTIEKRDRISVQTVAQRKSEVRHDKRQGRSTSSNFGVVCRRKYSTPCCNLAKRLLYKPNILTPVMYGIFVDLERCYQGTRPSCLVREESALVEVKFVPSSKILGLMETARKKKKKKKRTSFWRGCPTIS
ncbi:hypothetical protein PR048_001303 [Dryococelus australis]|uniref:Uncharacterized protein n=1 Tax=Dryococelus australis TaxID=614101 RepID=A0ABQ9IH26_9NEOP|nr:hypothetical protein PR048_001303 [Dryococelus australis]